MSRHRPEPDPRSDLEDEGIPDLQDGTPGQQWAADPQQAPVPGDQPIAVDDFGTTAQEQRQGEDLGARLAREEPEQQAAPGPAAREAGEPRRAGRLVAPSQGFGPDEEPDETATEAGPDRGGYSAEEDAMRIEPDGEAEPGGSRPRTAPD